MGARTLAREAALQMLFAIDPSREATDEDVGVRAPRVQAAFWRDFHRELHGDEPVDPDTRTYADAAVKGVVDARAELDDWIEKTSEHWRIARMTRVDRNVLRLAVWELLKSDVPGAVVLDEAVELAKRYGS